MAIKNLLDPDQNDLIPDDELKKSELFPEDDDLIPPGVLGSSGLFPFDEGGPQLGPDAIDEALGKISAEAPIELGGGVRLEPGAGRIKGLFITKDRTSVGNVADLRPEDQQRIRDFLRDPALSQNDLIPRDGFERDPAYLNNDLIPSDE